MRGTAGQVVEKARQSYNKLWLAAGAAAGVGVLGAALQHTAGPPAYHSDGTGQVGTSCICGAWEGEGVGARTAPRRPC
jgi:hypothetical protein